ncbi:hypothetical protein [Flavobacterium silvaticum]|uniref:Uncharacterized protein n=1 Tax=Flavobacterium silvaticum TaxID=1852020 RepID=A0A972JKC9_9FLAO|nr:hypothetical protein [Flavobacterium silvaticum]NMH29007.1 hypothetical protein [Flavobacterium silvaticum]
MIPEDKRKADDPELNQDASTYDKDESFEDSDDFHKYDDTANSNASGETKDSGKFDGNSNI